jgi:RNA recognition motif-containing protein
MEVNLFVGNLPRTTTGEELASLFAQAGEVVSTEIMRDPRDGHSRGFALVTMSAQSEADKAVSMFNSSTLDELTLKVSLARPREQRGFETGWK